MNVAGCASHSSPARLATLVRTGQGYGGPTARGGVGEGVRWPEVRRKTARSVGKRSAANGRTGAITPGRGHHPPAISANAATAIAPKSPSPFLRTLTVLAEASSSPTISM